MQAQGNAASLTMPKGTPNMQTWPRAGLPLQLQAWQVLPCAPAAACQHQLQPTRQPFFLPSPGWARYTAEVDQLLTLSGSNHWTATGLANSGRQLEHTWGVARGSQLLRVGGQAVGHEVRGQVSTGPQQLARTLAQLPR